MAFFVKADLLKYIDLSTLDQLTDADDTIVTDAIKDAEERIKERISQRIKTSTELAKTGTNRNRSLLKHGVGLAIFYLFQRLYTDVLPDGRVEAYEQAEKWLSDVGSGAILTTMDKQDEANQAGWPLRWGSELKKGSQNY